MNKVKEVKSLLYELFFVPDLLMAHLKLMQDFFLMPVKLFTRKTRRVY